MITFTGIEFNSEDNTITGAFHFDGGRGEAFVYDLDKDYLSFDAAGFDDETVGDVSESLAEQFPQYFK